ncbi:MAG: hypothetical protein Q4C98_01375 [Capnocytophaga sp.]|nr:hypothetical protein [Capnocytophaga sp.]
MKEPLFPYTKTFLNRERPVKLFLISSLLQCSYMFESREAYYRGLKNPKTYQEAELLSELFNILYETDKKPTDMQLTDDEYTNRIIDCTNAITKAEALLQEGLNIEKDFVNYFIQQVKQKHDLLLLVHRIGGIASIVFELLAEYDMGRSSKKECEHWIQFFINSDPLQHINSALLRCIFTQTLDLFWDTFQTFYNVDINKVYDEDALPE